MSVSASIVDYAMAIARAGTSGALALALGTTEVAANRVGLFADLTASAEQLALVVGGVTGPAFLRSGANVLMTGAKVQDSTFQIVDNLDTTKSISFQAATLGSGFQLTIDAGAQAANRTLTVPVLGATRTLALIDQAQTFTGAQTFSTAIAAGSGGTGLSSYVIGDLLYASTTSALSRLAGVATGNALISGGVGTAPSWGKVDLTTHISGSLPAANGGTGQTVYAIGDLLYASTTSALSKLADVATGNALISGGVGVAPSWGKIALTTHVSGILPTANGGTGINNAGTITNASATTITGGGTLALGGFTLTVPATGTAMLLSGTQTATGDKTFSSGTLTVSSAASTAQVIVSAVAGQVAQFNIRGNGVATGLVAQHDASSDATIANFANRSLFLGTNAITRMTIAATGEVTVSSATASTSTTTGSLVNAGGFGNAGAAYIGGALTVTGACSLDQVSSSGTLNGDYLYKIANASGTGLGLRVQAGADGLYALAVRNAASAISFSVTGAGLITTGSAVLMASSVALTNGAAAAAGTLANAPTAGNPTKWVPINDNGTTRYIPCW